MKRIFALLLAISMVLSLTLPAAAQELIEEIEEEVAEEVIEEAEAMLPSEEIEEIAEEAEAVTEEAIEEEVAEETVEEVVEVVSVEAVTVSAAASEAVTTDESEDMVDVDIDMLCQACTELEGQTVYAADCRIGHFGIYGLYLHQVDGPGFLTSVTLWLGESITVNAVVGNYWSQYPIYSPKGSEPENPLSVLTYDEEALEITAEFDAATMPMYQYSIKPLKVGNWTITYTSDAGETFSVQVHVMGEEDVLFYATDVDGYAYYDQNTPLQMNTNMTIGHIFRIRTIEGIETVDPGKLYATTDMLSITANGTDSVAYMLMVCGAKGYILYDHSDGVTYSIPVLSYGADQMLWDETPELLTTDPDGSDPQYSESLVVGAEVKRIFRIGSSGASVPVTKDLTADGTVLQLERSEEGICTITAKAAGTGYITDGTYYYYVTVAEAVVGDEMLFFELGYDPSGNTVKTYIDMQTNVEFSCNFCFGTKTSNIPVSAEQVTLCGNGVVEIKDTYYDQWTGVTYFTLKSSDAVGYAQLVYMADNGLEYVIPIKVYSGNYDNTNQMVRNYMEMSSTNGTVQAGIGRMNGELMTWASQFGGYYDQDEDPSNDMSFIHTIGLLVMENGSPVDYTELKDVRCQVLSCNDSSTDNLADMVYTNAVTVSPAWDQSIPAANLTTKAVRVTGAQNESFRATIAISYTFRGQRFTQQVWCFQTSNGDVTINADDLTDAGKLNVVLSSWDALTKWAKEKHGKTISVGNFINLNLPAVQYTDIIVAQAQSPFMNGSNSNPVSHIRLTGMTNGQMASMVGLIEKCCLNVVSGINFVADYEKTMTTTEDGEESFTCGILADYLNTTKPVYDTAYLAAYCGGEAPSLELPYVQEYRNAGLLQTCIDLGQVQNCNFTGFDYGVRSTLYGHVGSQGANTYANCYYGIYINNDGHEILSGDTIIGDTGGDAGNTSKVDYSYLTFSNNMYAVRIESIPNDTIDYYTRIHDSNFIDNYREFWISEPGTYYFYRNYFGGRWHDHEHHGHWRKHHGYKAVFDERDEMFELGKPRSGRIYYSEDGVRIIINPCRRTEDFYESVYWFYSGEDQNTVIEKGDQMLLSGEAIASLGGKAEVSLVNNGTELIKYTFHGKEGEGA